MAVLTIRDLDDEVLNKLRMRAELNRRSLEVDVRAILGEAVGIPVESGFGQALLALGVDLREAGVDPDSFIPERVIDQHGVNAEWSTSTYK